MVNLAVDERPCRCKHLCKKAGDGCFLKDEEYCGEAKWIYLELCPIMVQAGYKADKCVCDIPAIRAMWPKDKPCHQDAGCLPRTYKDAQAQVGKITNPEAIRTAFAAA